MRQKLKPGMSVYIFDENRVECVRIKSVKKLKRIPYRKFFQILVSVSDLVDESTIKHDTVLKNPVIVELIDGKKFDAVSVFGKLYPDVPIPSVEENPARGAIYTDRRKAKKRLRDTKHFVLDELGAYPPV